MKDHESQIINEKKNKEAPLKKVLLDKFSVDVVKSNIDYSYIIVGLVTFVGDSARGILFPALWPLCEKLGGTKVDLGYLVSIFSIGRLLISTRMGIISDKYRHRTALLLSGAILILGALLWSNTPFLGGLPMLYIAQLTLGLGTGSLGVTRSYVVEQTTPEKRTYRLARLSALQYAGFAATPLSGSALVLLGSKISGYWEYALPAYLIFLLAVLCFALLCYPFKDINETKDLTQQRQQISSYSAPPINNKLNIKDDVLRKKVFYIPIKDEEDDETDTIVNSSSTNSLLIVTSTPPATNITRKKSATSSPLFELNEEKTNDANEDAESTYLVDVDNVNSSRKQEKKQSLTTISSLHHNNNDDNNNDDNNNNEDDDNQNTAETIENNSKKKSIIKSPSTLKLDNDNNDIEEATTTKEVKIFAPQNTALNHVFYLMIFLNFTTRGAIATYESQASTILLDFYHITQLQLGFIVTISGSVGTLQLLFFKQFWTKHFSDMTLMIGGFFLIGAAAVLVVDFGPTNNARQARWRFILSMFIVYAIGYPIANSAVLGSFSTLQKAGRQATAQSQFALMGSFARVIFPVLAGYMEQYVDPTSSFAFNLLVVSLSMIGVMFFYDKILFFTVNSNNNNNNDNNNAMLTLKKFSIYEMNRLQWSVLSVCFLAAVSAIGAITDWGGIYD